MIESGQPNKRFDALDSWRGLAALLVALLHYPAWRGWEGADNRGVWAVAVPFFFVLSAFVLSHSLQSISRHDWQGFAVRRLARLYPLHLATALAMPVVWALVAIVVAVFGWIATSNFSMSFQQDRFTWPGLVDQLVMLQYIGPNAATWNPPSWSLSVEFFGALAMFPLLRMPATPTKTVVCCVLLLFSGTAYFADGGLLSRSNANLFGIEYINAALLLGLFTFNLGCLAYDLYRTAPTLLVRCAPALEVIITGTAILCLFVAPQAENEWALVPLVAAVFVFPHEAGSISKALGHSTLRYVGAISYSIYLLHYPILNLSQIPETIFDAKFPELFRIYRGLWIDKLLYVVVLLFLSHLSFRHFEKPAGKYLTGLLSRRPEKSVGV